MITKELALFVKKGLACVIVLLFVGTSSVSVLGDNGAGTNPQSQTTAAKTTPMLPGGRGQFYAFDADTFYIVNFDIDAVIHNIGYAGISFISGSDMDPDGNWYVVSFTGGLYSIDKDTGGCTYIAYTIPLNGLTYDVTTELWFACNGDSLFTIDITTGTTIFIGDFGINSTMTILMCDISGNLYGWGGDDYLYSIDKTTGEATPAWSRGFYTITGANFDRNDNTLYLATYDFGQDQGYLAICDLETGAITIIAPFCPNDKIVALAIPYTLPDHYLIADFTWTPLDPLPGETVLFNASKSYDSDGVITLYEWDWNNDGVYEEADTTPTTTHAWDSPGNYKVTLRVTDDGGYTAQKSKIIYIFSPPPEAPVIYGPDHGAVNVMYTFYANCSSDDQVFVIWDWGDGWPSSSIGPFGRNQNISATHTWTKPGVYEIRARVRDVWGAGSPPSNILVMTIVDNKPPAKPVITGQDRVKVKVSYVYSAMVTDPDKDQLYYFFDWQDGTTTGWLGPCDSGAAILVSHNWSRPGTVIVRIKAKDVWGAESDWGVLPIRIPYDNPTLSFFQWLFERFPHAFPLLRYLFDVYEKGG